MIFQVQVGIKKALKIFLVFEKVICAYMYCTLHERISFQLRIIMNKTSSL